MFPQSYCLSLLPLLILSIFIYRGVAADHVQLLPHVPSAIDPYNLHHLSHTRQAHIWFRENARQNADNALLASLNLTFLHPTIVLDHSFHTVETCTDSELAIHFFSLEAFRHARSSWSTNDKLVFITSKSQCRQFNPGGHHAYFSSEDVEYNQDQHIVRARGDFVDMSDIASHGRIEWGHLINPPTPLTAVSSTSNIIPMPTVASIARRSASTSALPWLCGWFHNDSCAHTDGSSRTSIIGSVSDAGATLFTQSQPSVTANPSSSPITSTPSSDTIYTIYSVAAVSTPSCDPPAAVINGLPAVAYCGEDFDKRLDEAIGTFNLEVDDVDLFPIFSQIAPGIADDIDNFLEIADTSLPEDPTPNSILLRRQLLSRRWKLKILASISHMVANVAKKVASMWASVAVTVAQDIFKGWKAAVSVGKAIIKAIATQTIKASPEFEISRKLVLTENADSPWGRAHVIFNFTSTDNDTAASKTQAYEIAEPLSIAEKAFDGDDQLLNVFGRRDENRRWLWPQPTGKPGHNVALYCINCGLVASFKATGHLEFSLREGVTAGQVTFEGELLAQLQLGFDAMVKYKATLGTKHIYHHSLTGWEIPGLIAVGPLLLVDLQAMLDVKAEGQILAGYALSSNATAVINFIDHSRTSYSGWHPTVQKKLKVHGELSVGVAVEMPINIGVGIDLHIWKLVNYTKSIGLVNKPGVYFDASVDVGFEYRTTTSPDGITLVNTVPLGDLSSSNNCPGIKLGAYLADRCEAEMGISTKTLWDMTVASATHCVTLWDPHTPIPTAPANVESRSLGCFQDHLGNGGAKRSFSAKSAMNLWDNTIQKCKAICVGYLYYGLENGNECYCADSASTGTIQLASGSCNVPCAGDASQTCGGFWSISLFAVEDPAYSLLSRVPGLMYWAWMTYPTLAFDGDWVDVPPIVNSPNYLCSGVVDNINVFATTPDWPWVIHLPGQTSQVTGDELTVILQGYFVPKLTGIYTFTPVTYDNKFLMWTGPGAHTSYDWNNAVINQWGWQEEPLPTTLIVEAGQIVPITIMWINWSNRGDFSIRITDPSGVSTMDTSGLFMHKSGATINDGQKDIFVVKRDTPAVAVTGDADITWSPRATGVPQVARRDATSVDSLIPTSTAGVAVVNPYGGMGIVSGLLSVTGDLPDGVDLISAPDGQVTFPQFPDFGFNTTFPDTTPNDTNGDVFTVDPVSNSSLPVLDYAHIRDATGTLQLHTGEDGNFHLVSADAEDAAGLYSGLSHVYSGDSNGNVFVYYEDEFAALNVSRFRAVSPDAIPTTARLAALAPIETVVGYYYALMDTMGRTMFLAYCDMEGSPSKVFVVESFATGLHILTRPELSHVVTGGIVTACGPLSLLADITWAAL